MTVATPAPSTTTGPPSAVPLSSNCTVPVGLPPPGATTDVVAVNVTEPPNSEGFADEPIAVVVSAGLTTCGSLTKPSSRSPLELCTLGLSLEKKAFTAWLPTSRSDAAIDAWPLASSGWAAP